MRHAESRTLFLATAVGLLFCASASAGHNPQFWVGTTAVYRAQVPGGKVHYVDVSISSYEDPSKAEKYRVRATMHVYDETGYYICSKDVELFAKLPPTIRPLRFEVFYPTGDITIKKFPPPAPVMTKYEVRTKAEVYRPGDTWMTTVENSEIRSFPVGGTRSCKKN